MSPSVVTKVCTSTSPTCSSTTSHPDTVTHYYQHCRNSLQVCDSLYYGFTRHSISFSCRCVVSTSPTVSFPSATTRCTPSQTCSISWIWSCCQQDFFFRERVGLPKSQHQPLEYINGNFWLLTQVCLSSRSPLSPTIHISSYILVYPSDLFCCCVITECLLFTIPVNFATVQDTMCYGSM